MCSETSAKPSLAQGGSSGPSPWLQMKKSTVSSAYNPRPGHPTLDTGHPEYLAFGVNMRLTATRVSMTAQAALKAASRLCAWPPRLGRQAGLQLLL